MKTLSAPRFARLAGCLCFLLASALAASSAQGQLSKIFVASFGNDANDGSRNAPKRNFQAAHDAVATGGQIVVLDTAGYGALSITKSLAVTVPPGVNGFVTTTGNATGIAINAGSSGSVSLRGLIIEGSSNSSGNGVYITSAGVVVLEDCTVRRFTEGIYAFTSTTLKLNVANCVARDCGYGLVVQTTTAVGVVATVTGCQLVNCSNDGCYVGAGQGTADVTLSDCTITGNSFGGVSAVNAGTVVRVEGSRIVNNANGILTTNGGQVLSRQNNTVEKNANENAFPANSTYSAK